MKIENKEKEFRDLIDQNKYQVFLFVCRAHFPFGFASHSWFVINRMGAISRYEVLYTKIKSNNVGRGYLNVNNQMPFLGIPIFPFLKKYLRNSKIIWKDEGDENSLARELATFIEKTKEQYPGCDKYSLIGPNSNTYTSWVLSRFPAIPIKLPWSFIGKSYKFDNR